MKKLIYAWLVILTAFSAVLAIRTRELDREITASKEVINALERREDARNYKVNAQFLLYLKHSENKAVRDTLITDLNIECLKYRNK